MKKHLFLSKKIALIFISSLIVCCAQKDNTINSNKNLGFSNDANYDNIDNKIYDSKSISQNKIIKNNNLQFVDGSKDVPLADGLIKFSDDILDFDFTSGNIASIVYKNKNDSQNIKKFYLKTLPALGWKTIKNKNLNIIKFFRDSEKLEIEFFKKNGNNFVKFLIIAS